jgi:predicted Zn-ribbon and HTH transcriptional regulator
MENKEKTFNLPRLKCQRCGHVWYPRSNKNPVRCARCKNPYWNITRQPSRKTDVVEIELES